MEDNQPLIPRSIPATQRKELPIAAQEAIARIDVMLAYAATSSSDLEKTSDSAYTLNETSKRYVPDTVNAYLAIPKPLRDDAAAQGLLQQLAAIETAVLQELNRLSEDKKSQLQTNGLFIKERFTSKETNKNTEIEKQIQRDAAQLEKTPERTVYKKTYEEVLEIEKWKNNRKNKTFIKLTTLYTTLVAACSIFFYSGEHPSTRYQATQSEQRIKVIANGLIATREETGSYPLAKTSGTVHDIDVTQSLVNSPEMNLTTSDGQHYKYSLVDKNTFILADPETAVEESIKTLPKANDSHHLPQAGGALCGNDCKHLGYSNHFGYFGF